VSDGELCRDRQANFDWLMDSAANEQIVTKNFEELGRPRSKAFQEETSTRTAREPWTSIFAQNGDGSIKFP